MKIIALQAENIKKLVAIEIRPDGNVVQITGKNGQGKTSVLDSIWWALGGAANFQKVPIRKGADQARIRLDLGEIVVTRTFRPGKDGLDNTVTTGLTVTNAEGAKFPSPQAMIDGLLGQLSFDPLAFSRMDPRQQFNTLRQFVPGVDFDAIDQANRNDYAKRTEINRRAKEERTLADKIEVTGSAPELVNEATLVDDLEQAAKKNAEIEMRRANRERLEKDMEMKRQQIENLIRRAEDLRKQADEFLAQAKKLDDETHVTKDKLENALPLPDPIDVSVLRQKIAEAQKSNEEFTRRKEKSAHALAAAKLEGEAQALTLAMDKREAEKREAISGANLPIKNLSFGDGEIMMNGVPFNQASDAEQLRVSIAIAMALNPKLRVIRVRDGSLLDQDSLKLISEMADEADYQIWLERVDDSGKVGFVLEDGHVKHTVPAKEATTK